MSRTAVLERNPGGEHPGAAQTDARDSQCRTPHPRSRPHRTGLQGLPRRAPARLTPRAPMASKPKLRRLGAQRHADGKLRCAWCPADPLYRAYHDTEWGVPLHDERALFEMLCLEGAQAGLSWLTILRKRENYRRAFDGFDAEKMVRYGAAKRRRLMLIRRLPLAVHGRQGVAPPAPVFERCCPVDRTQRRDEQGSQTARFPFRRLHHLPGVHAGRGHRR